MSFRLQTKLLVQATTTSNAVTFLFQAVGPVSLAQEMDFQPLVSSETGMSSPRDLAAQRSSMTDTRSSQIIYPSYKDTQLVNGKVVSPDQSYTPQKF